jgi:fumarylacetoacetase
VSRHTDHTHEASLKSWLPEANIPGGDFPIQNLPFGIFQRRGTAGGPRAGVAIGDRILDIAACARAGLFASVTAAASDGKASGSGASESALAEAQRAIEACGEPALNRLAALGRGPRAALRMLLSALLRGGDPRIRNIPGWETALLPRMPDCDLRLPFAIGGYTDFYASIHHATTVGSLFRPDQPLSPNYKYVPIGYHGRASSIVVSGTPVRRPSGQTKADGASAPAFGPCKVLDYEVEAGFIVGPGNAWGESIAIRDAEEHLFGMCLLNDWSARDIQKWEYQPLGPFLAKSFASSVSPWVVTLEALAPFRVPGPRRPEGDPAPLPYLDHGEQSAWAGLDVAMEAYLNTRNMRDTGSEPFRLSRSHVRDLYWTAGQMIAHHASNGCNLRPGDLLGSGTVSGPAKENQGCLLERTLGGKEPVTLPNGEIRRFLQDGDEIILKGYCEAPGFARIGLGECRGLILPAGG